MSDAENFAAYGAELADAVERALPDWVRRSVGRFVPIDAALERRVAEAGAAAAADIGPRLRDLLALEFDAQWTNPLSIVRSATRYPTAVLAGQGVAPVERDEQAIRFDPDDVYDLTPARFADLSPESHEWGIRWGAAKAHLHLRRVKR